MRAFYIDSDSVQIEIEFFLVESCFCFILSIFFLCLFGNCLTNFWSIHWIYWNQIHFDKTKLERKLWGFNGRFFFKMDKQTITIDNSEDERDKATSRDTESDLLQRQGLSGFSFNICFFQSLLAKSLICRLMNYVGKKIVKCQKSRNERCDFTEKTGARNSSCSIHTLFCLPISRLLFIASEY